MKKIFLLLAFIFVSGCVTIPSHKPLVPVSSIASGNLECHSIENSIGRFSGKIILNQFENVMTVEGEKYKLTKDGYHHKAYSHDGEQGYRFYKVIIDDYPTKRLSINFVEIKNKMIKDIKNATMKCDLI